MRLATFYTQTADNVGYCSGATLGSAGCHDGAGDQGAWRRRWDAGIHYASVVGTTTCAGCHGGFNGNDFTFGLTVNTTDGQVEHYRDWDGNNGAEVMPNHNVCAMCHAWPAGIYTSMVPWAAGVATGSGWHGNNQIDMNGSAGYTRIATTYHQAPAYGCTETCHNDAANLNHSLESSNWPLGLVTGPPGGCSGCHGGP